MFALLAFSAFAYGSTYALERMELRHAAPNPPETLCRQCHEVSVPEITDVWVETTHGVRVGHAFGVRVGHQQTDKSVPALYSTNVTGLGEEKCSGGGMFGPSCSDLKVGPTAVHSSGQFAFYLSYTCVGVDNCTDATWLSVYQLAGPSSVPVQKSFCKLANASWASLPSMMFDTRGELLVVQHDPSKTDQAVYGVYEVDTKACIFHELQQVRFSKGFDAFFMDYDPLTKIAISISSNQPYGGGPKPVSMEIVNAEGSHICPNIGWPSAEGLGPGVGGGQFLRGKYYLTLSSTLSQFDLASCGMTNFTDARTGNFLTLLDGEALLQVYVTRSGPGLVLAVDRACNGGRVKNLLWPHSGSLVVWPPAISGSAQQ